MEEKLYFKPASYGKGTNKKRRTKKIAKTKDNCNHRVRNTILFSLSIIVVILIIIWLLRGSTTTTGQYPMNVRNEYLSCESDKIIYEKASYVNSNSRDLKVNMIFYGENTFSSASLQYILNFDNKDEAHGAEATLHARFNKELAAVGLKPEAFNNKFSLMDNILSITLHASGNDINETTAGYFLIDIENDRTPSTLSDYKNNYERQGFLCKTSKQ